MKHVHYIQFVIDVFIIQIICKLFLHFFHEYIFILINSNIWKIQLIQMNS